MHLAASKLYPGITCAGVWNGMSSTERMKTAHSHVIKPMMWHWKADPMTPAPADCRAAYLPSATLLLKAADTTGGAPV